MIFATAKKPGNLDGELLLVHPDRDRAVSAAHIVPSLRQLLESWDQHLSAMQLLDKKLRAGELKKETQALASFELGPCVPRTWLFVDGSAFIHHIRLVRKARNAEPPATLLTTPLVYQAESGAFLGPNDEIPQVDFSHGTDFEGEVGVFVSPTPMQVTADQALGHIKLVTLINDVSLRGLIPGELAQGFGFFVSKPQKALAPFAVTPDELGDNWREGRLHLPLQVRLNGEFFGCANAGAMHFHFGQIIQHVAQTRPLVGGSLIGSGTVSNEDPASGSSCIAEKRTIEQIETGAPSFSYMKVGDKVEMWMEDPVTHQLIFGKISQKVTSAR